MSDAIRDTDENRRDDLIFELIKDRIKGERERSIGLDNKAGNLIGFTSVVIGLLLGTISLKLDILIHNPLLSITYFIGIGVLLLSIFFSLMVIKIRGWIIVPNVRHLLDYYTAKTHQELLRRNAATMANAVGVSERNNGNKARYTQWSWCSLLSGLVMVFIFMLLYILTGAKI
jgi:hypothetical protein